MFHFVLKALSFRNRVTLRRKETRAMNPNTRTRRVVCAWKNRWVFRVEGRAKLKAWNKSRGLMFQHVSGIYFEGSLNGTHFSGIPQTMGIYGNFEGFLLHRGLFWASNIMTPVFGVHRYFFWGLWRTPVNPINVAMLTMEVVNPLVQKTYFLLWHPTWRTWCLFYRNHMLLLLH